MKQRPTSALVRFVACRNLIITAHFLQYMRLSPLFGSLYSALSPLFGPSTQSLFGRSFIRSRLLLPLATCGPFDSNGEVRVSCDIIQATAIA